SGVLSGGSGLLLLLASLTVLPTTLYGDEQDRMRIQVGLKLFPTLLAADQEISQKQTRDGKLLLLMVYRDRKEPANQLAEQLGKIETIRDIPILIKVTSISELTKQSMEEVAGLFLAEKLNGEINTVISLSESHELILFSPFRGDVERGVLGGIYISDRILPYINGPALQASQISLKPFYLKVAKKHE
ncbi:MAG: hypothetical protein KAJ19_01665, partial [Gammaproteobacteria bacterium]|nr:hypothetical protein [Gammaproteobacteria bacterium]